MQKIADLTNITIPRAELAQLIYESCMYRLKCWGDGIDADLAALHAECERQYRFDQWYREDLWEGNPPPDFIRKLGVVDWEERINTEGKWEKFVFHGREWRRVPKWQCDQRSHMAEHWRDGTKWEIIDGKWTKFFRKQIWEAV